MFKFDFDIEDAEDLDVFHPIPTATKAQGEEPIDATLVLEPFSEVPITQLLDSVPQLISYSPISISLSSTGTATTLVRRDLFDARFQLISEGAGDTAEENEDGAALDVDRKALQFLDAPSDLVPGVYEGGLKTWECSLDVVDYLNSNPSSFVGKKVVEIGCGTGVPSMYIFREILDRIDPSGQNHEKRTEIHLQDYNASVLRLVTLPNILLTWYTSIHADPYRYTTNDSEVAPTVGPKVAGELPITPELKEAFLASLESLNISLHFFSGSWDSFDPLKTAGPTGYDIVLSSETIYRTESLPPLLNLMASACTGRPTSLEGIVSSLSIEESGSSKDYLCLVAAKVLYFGVGGGVSDFVRAVEGRKGRIETVLERTAGVGRKIMRVWW
ncbi:hypothetical protein D9619_010777 [Psilocybe cf. subviscida]|uniref:protein-histidine N-methyltransferase n=1 Tax=Psilocybe cf. subviscida TaxID=2480587 RepID=A0A8H5EZR4_9AGAR|nr:hypothetical protein D9619_010777 [Psilocybe cf. subviscida]